MTAAGFAVSGCAASQAELEARAALERAETAAHLADALEPERQDALPYRLRIEQAHEALADGAHGEALDLADVARDQAERFRARETERVERATSEREALAALVASLDPAEERWVDHATLGREVRRLLEGSRQAFDAGELDRATELALYGRALVERRAQLFPSGFPVPEGWEADVAVAGTPGIAVAAGSDGAGYTVCYRRPRGAPAHAVYFCSDVIVEEPGTGRTDCDALGYPDAQRFRDVAAAVRWIGRSCCPF